MELHCWHHWTEIHCLAPTVTVRLGFGGYSRSCHHGQPHHFVPCLTGREVNSQLIKVGDEVSGRAIVPLMVHSPGGWLPAVLYAHHHQVYISFMPQGTHQWGGFNLKGLSPRVPLPSMGCLSHSLQCAGASHKPVWLSYTSLGLLMSKKLVNVEHRGSRQAHPLPSNLDVPSPCGHQTYSQGLSHTLSP